MFVIGHTYSQLFFYREEQNKSRPGSRGASYDIYASLPRSLKKELLVREKVEENEDELKKRQNLVETKSPAELSEIHSLSEVPLPRRVESWLQHSDQQPGYVFFVYY